MNRAFLLLLAFLLPVLLPACNHKPDPPANLVIAFGTAPVSATSGQVITVDAPSPILTAGQDYELSWIDGAGQVVLPTTALAISQATLGLQAPTLPAGHYDVDIDLGLAAGRFSVEIADAPVVANPAAFVATFRTDFETLTAELLALANNEVDPAVRAAQQADLAEIDRRYRRLTTLLVDATPLDVAELATFLAANSALLPQPSTDFIDENLSVDAASRAVVGGVTKAVYGAGVLAWSLYLGNPLLIAAGVAGGLLVIRQGLREFSAGVHEVFRPLDQLLVFPGDSGGFLDTGGHITITQGSSIHVSATGRFRSVSIDDRASTSSTVQGLFVAIDRMEALFSQGVSFVLSLVQSRPEPIGAPLSTADEAIDPARLTIESQSNPAVTLTLTNGQLSAATLLGGTLSTTVAFRYSAGDLGSLTTAVAVEVLQPCDPTVPLTAVPILPDDFVGHHTIDFEGETEPHGQGPHLLNLRLGSESPGAFYVDVVAPPPYGFALLELSPTATCLAVSAPNIGQAYSSAILTPRAPISSFGGYFLDAVSNSNNSTYDIVAVDCLGRGLTLHINMPYCACQVAPHCSEVNRWNGYRFSTPIVSIEFRIRQSNTYTILTMDNLLFQEWEN